jgi:hypothetical protein
MNDCPHVAPLLPPEGALACPWGGPACGLTLFEICAVAPEP